MADILLGLGRQKSLQKVVAMAEAHLAKLFGAPKTVTARSDLLDIEALRDENEGQFNACTLRVRECAETAQALKDAEDELSAIFGRTEEDGFQVYTYPRNGDAGKNGSIEAIDVLAQKLKLPEVWRIGGSGYREDPISVELMFKAMVQYKASDTHLTPGKPPIFRIDNQLRVSELMGNISANQIEGLIHSIAPAPMWERYKEDYQCTFSFQQAGIGYARASAFIKSGAPHLTFRFLPEKIPSFQQLGLDEEMMLSLSKLPNGLLIVAGMTGTGKTTTCAAVIDWINNNKNVHILGIESPIEYVHTAKKAFLSQRELGVDVKSYGEGVEAAVHQDPDVIFIGEMSDADTIRSAISAASTGHLVVSTIHSSNASGLVNRIVSFFDPVERELIRAQLQDNLACVLCQKLIPKAKGGRIPAVEVLFNDIKPISTAIRDGNTLGIRLGMQQTLSKSKLFEHYLFDLYKKEVITLEIARDYSPEVSLFDQINMGTYTVPRMDSG